MGVEADVRERLLGVIEQRCIAGRNGATWLIQEFAHHSAGTTDRLAAMRATTQEYEKLVHAGEAVHLWPTRS
ncbi:hypothetical protein [Aeromicrobium sp. UC242_57]|uniref:hypothetical protein n=1 Tax=Aeromicrobium sp. UC242_57 TaxID=3374624 RepID=UPI00379873A1